MNTNILGNFQICTSVPLNKFYIFFHFLSLFVFISVQKAMYKTRNTGTGNEMRGTRGMGGMLYSRECRPTFRGIYSNIPENIVKHSEECSQTFRGMSPNIPGNIAKYSEECCQTFQGMSSNIPGNVAQHSGKCCQTFRGMPYLL